MLFQWRKLKHKYHMFLVVVPTVNLDRVFLNAE